MRANLGASADSSLVDVNSISYSQFRSYTVRRRFFLSATDRISAQTVLLDTLTFLTPRATSKIQMARVPLFCIVRGLSVFSDSSRFLTFTESRGVGGEG